MARMPMAAALALALAAPVSAGVEVTAAGDRVDVIAARAPVAEVLAGLARKTRMKVVYEGPAPQTLVTVELKDRTPAQAVLGVLEGLGLNYALALDLSGTEVETLMIVGTSGASTGAMASAAARGEPRGARRPNPRDAADEEEMEIDEVIEVEARGAGAAAGAPNEVPDAESDVRQGPPPPGPLNPTAVFPNASPFAPGPPPLVGPSPSPPPPSDR